MSKTGCPHRCFMFRAPRGVEVVIAGSVSVTQYRQPLASVREAVDSCAGFAQLSSRTRVFIKPNIVFWTRACRFPKWGVITTSRVVQDIVVMLREQGIEDITIGEGTAGPPADRDTPAHAFETLGYRELQKRYGVKILNIMERPFEKVSLGNGMHVRMNRDALESDFLVNLPVLKTHNQTVVSLGLKNLKGLLDFPSRRSCHQAEPGRDLHAHVARLAGPLPPSLTLIDGIYSLERGPAFDGRMRRSNLLVASGDPLSADLVGAFLLGHDPVTVPHLAEAARLAGRSPDPGRLEVAGLNPAEAASYHPYSFDYESWPGGEMPAALARRGLEGLFYRRFDQTMCTYCSALNGLVLNAINRAWRGSPWNRIEVLTGKMMEPAPGMEATVLVGRCMYRKNKDHPYIRRLYTAPGCPPDPIEVAEALRGAGVDVELDLFEQRESLPGLFSARYEGNPDFDEDFFQVRPLDNNLCEEEIQW